MEPPTPPEIVSPAEAEPSAPPPPLDAPIPPLYTVPPAEEVSLRRPPIDWEALLGVRGAAWVGAIALVVAGTLFAKYSIENNLIPPAVRVALIILFGIGAVVGAELVLRRGYATTANAAAGAGVALLYAGFFAGHALYKLVPLVPTFALMVLTTVVACLLSVRHNAMFIAVLGLLGGFATPLLLSTGQDRPAALFSYILLLDVGLLVLAARRAWPRLAQLSLIGTFVIQLLWFSDRMTPEKTVIVAVAFTLFAVLYLAMPWLGRPDDRRLLTTSAAGGLLPFLFIWYLSGQRVYGAQWPILFGFMAALDAALIVVALRRGQGVLATSAAVATQVALVLWGGQALSAANLWGPTLGAMGLCALLSLAPELRRVRYLSPVGAEPDADAESAAKADAALTQALSLCATVAAAGLGIFGLQMALRGLGEPPWPFLVLLTGLVAATLRRCQADLDGDSKAGVPYLAVLGPLAVALLVQAWFFAPRPEGVPRAEHLLRDLSVPLLVAAVFSVWAALQSARRGKDGGTARAEAGALAAALACSLGLFLCLDRGELGRAPAPLFAAQAVVLVLLGGALLRRGWTFLMPIGLLLTAALCAAWHDDHFQASDVPVVMPIYAGFYLVFLVLPLLHGGRTLLLHGTSALSGPLFFWVLYRSFVSAWGKGAIGALPVLLAAFSLVGLARVRQVFTQDVAGAEAGEAEARRRLRSLALFASVALGFVSLAIPLQLDRQWITLGWALEAAAVSWLYLRLPHPGLKYFAAGLYLAVALRLLPSQEVLRYEERGMLILNWILYTYGVPAVSFLWGGWQLGKVEEERLSEGEKERYPLWRGKRVLLWHGISALGLLLIFVLINLEIADAFSAGRYVELTWARDYARALTVSMAWGVYALVLLGVGMWRGSRGLRMLSLGFMLLTVLKVFLSDLSSLRGLYQVLSFLGLAASLIFVSLLYQRFVFRKDPKG
jgi:uncharacterized membrane protein